mgnify:CR=1 FL=1
MPAAFHRERHRIQHIGWLRAAVLGANDGLVSTASLIAGVAAASASADGVLIAGVAALVAGSLSMAAGEYVSVSSQADVERADLERERHELATDPEHEHEELAGIYETRGLDAALAREVATQMMAKDALGAHVRDELGMSEIASARPLQAALTSALSFALGASLPLLVVIVRPPLPLVPAVIGFSLLCLAALGAVAARTGGAAVLTGAGRVTLWGAAAMALTAAVGSVFGTVVS